MLKILQVILNFWNRMGQSWNIISRTDVAEWEVHVCLAMHVHLGYTVHVHCLDCGDGYASSIVHVVQAASL